MKATSVRKGIVTFDALDERRLTLIRVGGLEPVSWEVAYDHIEVNFPGVIRE